MTVPASTSRKGIKIAQLLSVQANETKGDRRGARRHRRHRQVGGVAHGDQYR